MAKIKDDYLSGIIGPVVAAKWKDIRYIRARPKRSKSKIWSEKQIAHRKCFAAVNEFSKSASSLLIKPIWNLAAHGNLTGYNLFLKANKPAFEPEGELADPRLLKMTMGDLPLPLNIDAGLKRNTKLSIEVSWENPEVLDPAYNTDQLMLIFFKNGRFTVPMETGFSRDKTDVEIILPEEYREMECVFIFFKNKEGNDFSESFGVKV